MFKSSFSPVYSRQPGREHVMMIQMDPKQEGTRRFNRPRCVIDDSCDGGCVCSVLLTIMGFLIVAGLFYIFVSTMGQPDPSTYGPSRYEG